MAEQRFKRYDGSVEETRASVYDKAGNLLSRSDLNGSTAYAYDDLNRVAGETRTTTTSGIADAYVVNSFYDAAGNRTKGVYPDTDRELVSTYDRANRMVQLDDDGLLTTTFGYDAAGNRISHAAPNDVTTVATFDALNRVETLVSTGVADINGDLIPNDVVYDVSYKYDLAGNRRSATEAVAAVPEPPLPPLPPLPTPAMSRQITWDYDGVYRLTGESWTGFEAQARTYTYDPAGNRLTRTIDPDGTPPAVTTTYAYDDLNQMNVVSVGGVTTDYSYDPNGNLFEKYVQGGGGVGIISYSHDTSNRLVSVANEQDGPLFAAAYDARTRRIAKTEYTLVGSTSTPETKLFRYDGGTNFQELEDADGQGSGTAYAIFTELVRAGGQGGGIGSVLYTDQGMAPLPLSGPVEHFVYNAVGHTVATTDAQGAIRQSNVYEAFGETVAQDGDSTNNRLRNTKERDTSINLDNDGFRYYDPEVGRYVQRDPIGYGDGLNVYASVGNNPVNRVDPLGLASDDRITGPIYDYSSARCMSCHGTGVISGQTPVENLNPAQQWAIMRWTRTEGPREAQAAVAQMPRSLPIAQAVGESAASFVPGVGEAMDVAVLADPDAAWWEKGLAGVSLGANALTGGLLPNFGGFVRGGKRLAKMSEMAPDVKRMFDVVDAKHAADAAQNGKKIGKKIPTSELTAPPSKRGNAPIGSDGRPVELHHREQTPDGLLDEMTMTGHRGKGNFGKNHSNTGQEASKIDRDAWKKEQKEYWSGEYDSGRFEDFNE